MVKFNLKFNSNFKCLQQPHLEQAPRDCSFLLVNLLRRPVQVINKDIISKYLHFCSTFHISLPTKKRHFISNQWAGLLRVGKPTMLGALLRNTRGAVKLVRRVSVVGDHAIQRSLILNSRSVSSVGDVWQKRRIHSSRNCKEKN